MSSYFQSGYIVDGYTNDPASIGDQSDQFNRIKALIPPNWFSDTATYLDAIIWGFSCVNAFIYTLIAYAKLQTRIKTATDGWLDLIASDFFGTSIVRGQNQTDDSFRNQIVINLFRERGTRNSVSRVLIDITKQTPTIVEPMRMLDTGAYGAPINGYGMAGGYGSMILKYQATVTAHRPADGSTSDVDIYSAIESVRPVATILNTGITS